jgi:hypothetical protein
MAGSPFQRLRGWAVALSISASTLGVCAPASAEVQTVFQDLIDQRLRPAPLVPTTAPRDLRPIDDSILTFDQPRGYGIRMQAPLRGRPRAIVDLQGDVFASVRAALRSFREAQFRVRSTRVRERRGYLLTMARQARRPPERLLLWAEGGIVYYLHTRTTDTVSVRELRVTATGLDRLEGVFLGNDARGDNEAQVAVTTRTVSADVQFTAPCTETATGERSATRRAAAGVTLAPRGGDSFSFDIGPNLRDARDDFPWQGTVSGTIGANGATLDLRATGSSAEDSCDTGPVSLTLRRG